MTFPQSDGNEPIAIVGMGVRMPGGVRDIPGLWEFLRDEKDVHKEFGAPRFSSKGFYHPNPDRPGTAAAASGFVLDEDPLLFDPGFFNITDLEVDSLDAGQRKLLECTYEAFEAAGDTLEDVSGTRMGVYVGDISMDNYVTQARDWDYGTKFAATGAFPNMLANRIHYIFNLKGPSLLVNSACTSAMYALHLAVKAIHNGDCDSAIVAGSNWILEPSCQFAMGKLGALSPTSRSHTFDASADGYARGEGFCALYLKKPKQAIADGSPIRALIMGSAVNANGRTTGITNPSGPAQEIVIREAYKNANNLDPSLTTLLECHGTGTRVGDPTEVRAAGNVFGPARSDDFENRLLVGSVKTNLGHLEGACALPGILKVITALEKGEIPATLGFKNPNPRIDFDEAKARVVAKTEPWPTNRLKRASVTSAGFGGTNGHCVIDHVNNYIPNYVKPGVIAHQIEKANGHVTNEYGTNGHDINEHGTNGHRTNGYITNGHTTNGHAVNGYTNGHTMNEYTTNGHTTNGYTTNGYTTNGYTTNEYTMNGSTTNGSKMNGAFSKEHVANGKPAPDLSGLLPQHYPITNRPTLIREANAGTRQLVLLPFSAHSEASLRANMDAISPVLAEHSLADVAYTLAAKRSRFTQRAFHVVEKDQVVQKGPSLEISPKITSSPQEIRVAFIFTGQGAQWPEMGAELFQYAVFKDAIDYLDSILALLPEPASWKIADVFSGNCDPKFVHTPAVSQTVCTALQIGLVDLLASWSVQPTGVVGHSSGEIAAAYAAGRLTAAEAICIAYYRGHVVSHNKQQGAMLAVGLSQEDGSEYIHATGLDSQVTVAAINSPSSITMSGNTDAIDVLVSQLTAAGVFNRVLRTGGLAYHSHHMLPLGSEYVAAVDAGLQRLTDLGTSDNRSKYPLVPWVSSVTPDAVLGVSKERVPSSYWRQNLESPVRFTTAVSTLLNSDRVQVGALLELGPHPALKNPIGQILKSISKTIPVLGSLQRGENASKSVLDMAGSLFVLNAKVNLTAVNALDKLSATGERALVHGCTAVDLPKYQFVYGPVVYHESRLSKDYRLRNVPRHDLLGSKVPGTTRLRPQWRNLLRLKDLPWLDDHRVPPHVLHPGAAHIVMSMVAAEQSYQEFPDALPIKGLTLRNVSIKKTLVVPEDDHGIEIVLSMEHEDGATARSPGWSTFSISSVVRDSDQWTEHCAGMIKVEVSDVQQPPPIDVSSMDERKVDPQSWYKRFADMGLKFGPSFQGYSEIHADPAKNVVSSRLALNTTTGMFPGGESTYPIHPASFDLVIRLGLMAINGGQSETLSVQLPIHLDQMRFTYGKLEGREWATGLGRGESRGLRGAYAQLQMLGNDGEVMLDVNNMRFIDLNNEQQARADMKLAAKPYSSPFLRLVWRPDIRTLSKEQSLALLPMYAKESQQYAQLSNIFDLLGHANPNLRVLVLRTSNSVVATEAALNSLIGVNSIKRYREFVLTDIPGAIGKSDRFAFEDVSYHDLDIEKDPLQQGFKPIYDVVLSSNALYDSPNLSRDLENCRHLLKPDGNLVLVEPTNSIGKWNDALQKAGFPAGAKFVAKESTNTGHEATIILSTLPGFGQQNSGSHASVHLLHSAEGKPALLEDLSQELQRRGLSSVIVPFHQVHEAIEPEARVIAFLDGENHLFDADQQRISYIQHLAAKASTMIWITSCGMVKGRNPDGAFVHGLLRTLGAENPSAQFLSIDIDAEDFAVNSSEKPELLRCIVDQELELQHSLNNSGQGEVNRDFTWQDGSMWISRYVPDGVLERYNEPVVIPEDNELRMMPLRSEDPVRAAFSMPGILSSLYFRPYTELLQPLPRDSIELNVKAIGLNWKDLGLCTGRLDQNNLSNEYCGVVTKIGSKVTNIQVGDLVYGMGRGHFGNYTRVAAVSAQKVPDGVDPLDAATMPLIYMTAVYAFEYVTRLRKGQKVLIQSASGGLGLAAIQLARSKGADVFVTAGNAEKLQFLTQEMEIPANRIFSSRDQTDVMRMVQATEHDGFDVILCSAQGDMLYESINALAPMGHLIDVGRMDVTSSKSIGLSLFQKGAGFTSFDLGLVVDRDPILGGELMRTVNDYYAAGTISPIRPKHVTDVSDLDRTLLRFSKGTHIGKMVVSYENPASMVKMHEPITPAQFDPEARYIVVGGLSAIGRSIVRWMCDRGARDLDIWSRNGAKSLAPEAVELIKELEAKDVRLNTVACDVSDREAVFRAVQEASSDRNVRGVLNFAVQYHDISFAGMTADKFHGGMAAKVMGTKNLHDATISLPLDFFVMTSTVGTRYAFPTQSTYLAANNFIDYFARFRRRQGLPASTVSLSFINDLGGPTQDPITVSLFMRAKGQTVTGKQAVRLIEPAFLNSTPTTATGSETWLGQSKDPLSDAMIITGADPAALAAMKRNEAMAAKVAATSAAPRWHHDPTVSTLMRALDDAWRHFDDTSSKATQYSADGDNNVSPVAQLHQQFQEHIKRIKTTEGDASKEEHAKAVALTTDGIRSTVSTMLFIDASEVNVGNTVADHGVDSLLTAEFRNWLHVAYGKKISMLDLMNPMMSISALATKIVDDAINL